MKNTVTQYIQGVPDVNERRALQQIINPIADRLSSQSLSDAGLVIKAGASPLVKTGAAAYYASAKGVLVTKAGSTDMAALSGTVLNATFNVFVFFIDSAGTLTSGMGIAGTTLARVQFPEPPVGAAIIGFVIINPTGTGNFVGGTTALDDATVVPNAAYINVRGAFDETIILG